MSADHVEKHWPDNRTGSLDVGYGAGLAEEHLTPLRPRNTIGRRRGAVDPPGGGAVPWGSWILAAPK